MLHSANAITSGRLSACIIVIMASLVSLVFAACSSDGGPNPAAANDQPQTLRRVLLDDQLTMVALLDSETPFPPTAGKTALFIDGDFYTQADPAVLDYVRQQVEAGVPIALFGDQTGYEPLCLTIGAGYTLPCGPQSAEIGVRGLKFYAARNPDRIAHSHQIELLKSQNDLAPLIEPMIQWAQERPQQ